MKALLSICLLWGLLFPGVTGARPPLTCYQCMGEDCADPKIQKCDAHQEACYASLAETTLANSLMSDLLMPIRQCAPASFCMNSYVSMSTLNGGTSRSVFQCCYTDKCNNMTISLPKRVEYPPNGVECPACFVINATECQQEETMRCTGGETKCYETGAHISIDFLGQEANMYFQGCATPNACYTPLPDAESIPNKVKIIFNERHCTDGNVNV